MSARIEPLIRFLAKIVMNAYSRPGVRTSDLALDVPGVGLIVGLPFDVGEGEQRVVVEGVRILLPAGPAGEGEARRDRRRGAGHEGQRQHDRPDRGVGAADDAATVDSSFDPEHPFDSPFTRQPDRRLGDQRCHASSETYIAVRPEVDIFYEKCHTLRSGFRPTGHRSRGAT